METEKHRPASPPSGDAPGEHLLRDLHEGRTSRNLEYDRFREPGEHRVLSGYRRLRSLARELLQPGVEICVVPPQEGGDPEIELRVRRLSYRRRVRLSPGELAFLFSEMVPPAFATSEFSDLRGGGIRE